MRGTPAALLCVIGDLFGNILLMMLSLVGVGAILATSVTLFQIVKWTGVAYLAYLGYCQIIDARKEASPDPQESRPTFSLGSFNAGFLTAALNPKAVMFYLAFLTQFMDPDGDQFVQFSILLATSTIVTGLILSGYVLIAARARKSFQSGPARKYFGYTGGGFLIGGSVLMATSR